MAAVLAGLGPGSLARPAWAAHSNVLWHVVHDLCVRDRRLTGLSAPCIKVDLEGGYAIVPDPGSRAQLLVVPTRRVTGIEDPQLLEPGAPDYWQAAWAARDLLARRIGEALPRQDVAMAVNAVTGRSQDQLHIHLSCVRPDVAETLRQAAPSLGDDWSTMSISGRPWRVRVLSGQDLVGENPFKLLADAGPPITTQMGRQTLVIVAARDDGFFLLSRSADLATGYSGHGEFLLDERCAAVRAGAPDRDPLPETP